VRQQLGLPSVEVSYSEEDGETHSDAFYTPLEWAELVDKFYANDGGLTLDPAWHPNSLIQPEIGYTRAQNGLVQPWPKGANGYLNPPYSDVTPFLELVSQHHSEHGGTWLILLKVDTSTAWWRQYVWEAACRVSFLYSRVGFRHQGQKMPHAAWPSAFVLYAHREKGPRRRAQLSRFSRCFGQGRGHLWKPD